MFLIKEIMSTKLLKLTKSMPVYDAAQLLVDYSITGAPVVDEHDMLVGIVSEFDLLPLLTEEGAWELATVEKLMSKTVVSFEDTATANEVCAFFVKNPSKRRVPVTHDGKLVGMVTRGDLLKLIVKVREYRHG